ncbi:nitroreductase family protein [Pseudobacteroides cellulosolvens]|uniref:Nitroreductase n=1 Tax=Pseudobacteroides cellulosolvens ATCC 35603 = DSM 2933 TaxID=398512 RepID=A0A0L6JM77_9FIRM|nr:nitroreductase family protein [Pseudobacteroides cellulosolvens]KNY26858.1 nitroreductase [Pseudobacteroides cellulosolvens ATCC 35603 = DSM 2933]
MEDFLSLAASRRSIRKFMDKDIPKEDIQYFINAAVSAPSGCNSQCWRFVAIQDVNILKRIEEAVTRKVESILKIKGNDLPDDYLASKKKMVSFFTKAPLVFAVFMTKAQYYDPIFISALKENGYDDDGIMKLFANYDLLSIGAAVQNLLLAVHEKGYGACWMNEPAICGDEINKILGVSNEERFISIIPVGIPAYTPRGKKMKAMEDVFNYS